MRILLTGASGFIGGSLAQSLAARHDVVALVRRPGSTRDRSLTEVVHDLTEPLTRARLPDRVDAVIHLAQSEHYRDFPDHAADVLAVNVVGTFQLLEYARLARASTFVYTSTGGVYGTSFERFAESDPVDPIDFYLTSKYSAELLIGNYRRFFRTVVLRPFFVYGPGQAARMLVPRLIERVRRGERITVDGEPGLKVNPIFVTDAIRVFEPVLDLADSGVFNVAGADIVTMTELIREIGLVVGREPIVEYAPAANEGDLVGDTSRMRDVLGVEPQVALRAGLEATAGNAGQPAA